MFLVTVTDAGDLIDAVVFRTHAGAAKFFEAMVEFGWDADISETTIVEDEDVDGAIEAMTTGV